jgi:hypothetical protein
MPGAEKPAAQEANRHIEIEEIPSLPMDGALSIIGEETRANIILDNGDR